MNKRKLFTLALTLCMVAILAIGGTLAYFTDTDSAKNVFTVGGVDVTLYETYVHREADSYDANLDDIAKNYVAGDTTDAMIIATSSDYQRYLENIQADGFMPGMAINKMPYVRNEGASNAYVRIRVLIPEAYDQDQLMGSVICTSALEEEFKRPAGYDKYDVDSKVTRDGKVYNQYTFIRNDYLEPNEMTYWNVWNTINLGADVVSGDAIEGETFNVLVEVDAIQAATFADVDAAFEAFDAQ